MADERGPSEFNLLRWNDVPRREFFARKLQYFLSFELYLNIT